MRPPEPDVAVLDFECDAFETLFSRWEFGEVIAVKSVQGIDHLLIGFGLQIDIGELLRSR